MLDDARENNRENDAESMKRACKSYLADHEHIKNDPQKMLTPMIYYSIMKSVYNCTYNENNLLCHISLERSNTA